MERRSFDDGDHTLVPRAREHHHHSFSGASSRISSGISKKKAELREKGSERTAKFKESASNHLSNAHERVKNHVLGKSAEEDSRSNDFDPETRGNDR